MQRKYNVLILFGGGGSEHDVSAISKNFYKSSLEEKIGRAHV